MRHHLGSISMHSLASFLRRLVKGRDEPQDHSTTVLLNDFDDRFLSSVSNAEVRDGSVIPRPWTLFPSNVSSSLSTDSLLRLLEFCSYYKRYLIPFFAAFMLYPILKYLYSDPERWRVSETESLSGPLARPIDVIVESSGRLYEGAMYGQGMAEYVGWKGLRYAEAPIGGRRFRESTLIEVKPVSDVSRHVIDAKEWDIGCARIKDGTPGKAGLDGEEDCLRVNIFTPARRIPGHLLPVMFWIHGGGFVAGFAADSRFEPGDLMSRASSMERPMVVVSINYRLGAFGFSATPPKPGAAPIPPHIPTQRPTELDLNVGLKDQLVALHWVQREIAKFGGDPAKVTLVGMSAGATSVGLHQLYSPSGLFRAAFMMSGGPTSFPVPWPHDASARVVHPLASTSQCPSPESQNYGPPMNAQLLSCLRNLTTAQVIDAARTLSDTYAENGWFPWLPVLEGDFDGSWINVRPSDRIVRGTFNKIPIIMGSVVDEGTRFTSIALDSQEAIKAALHKAFAFAFGAVEELLEPIWEFYPAHEPSVGSPYHTGKETFGLSSAYKQAASLLGDLFFQAPRRHLLRETPKDFGEAAWSYVYTEPREGGEGRMGVQHGADMTSWWGHPETSDPEIRHLSRHMTSYLINFVNHMDPNGPGCERCWLAFSED